MRLYFHEGDIAFPDSNTMSIQLYDKEGILTSERNLTLENQTLGFQVEFINLAPDSVYNFVYWDPNKPDIKHKGSF